MTFRNFHHVNLIVSDREKTKAFYNGILGLEIAIESVIEDDEFSRGVGLPNTKVLAAFFKLPNNGGLLETFQYIQPQGKPIPEDAKANDGGFQHLCFQVDDIEETYRELTAKGVRFLSTPVTLSTFGGVRFCYFLGPDRELVEILQTP
ncbi:MAG: VOC family protein [Bryobacteraceae bacterium]|jgi:catechol 2,3-dioxygenase-like lactoylglutathione lyase family enzyme